MQNKRLSLISLLLLVACSSPEVSTISSDPDPGDLQWPEMITWDRLPDGWDLHGWQAPPVSIEQAADSGGIQRMRYRGTERPVAIEVTATETGYFFIRSDCLQGHYDFPVGPFVGDPRAVLDATLPCLNESLSCTPVGVATRSYLVGTVYSPRLPERP